MKYNLTRERILIITIGVFLLVSGGIYRFLPESDDSSGDGLEIKKQQIVKTRGIVAEKSELEKAVAELKKMASSADGFFFKGASASLAAVEIQNIINSAAAANDVRIKTTDIMKESAVGKDSSIVAVPVRLTFDANLKQLQGVLSEFEYNSKYLTINDTVCTVSSSEPGILNIVLTLQGYMEKVAE